MSLKIGILGANKLIGQAIMDVLIERDIDVDTLYPLTHPKQSGREISFGDKDIKTISHADFDYSQCDVLFVCDNRFPLPSHKNNDVKIISLADQQTQPSKDDNMMVVLPSARAVQLIAALKPLQKYTSIKRVVVTTFEATSNQGKDGMDELFNQSRKFFVHDAMENNVFSKQIAFNIIPQVDEFMDDGQSKAEWLFKSELKNHLDKKISLSVTCTQAPVFLGTSMTVAVEFDGDISKETANDLWRSDNDTVVIDRGSEMEFVTPSEIAGEDQVFISRVREDSTVDSGLSFWCVADNIRLTAVKAIEALQKFN